MNYLDFMNFQLKENNYINNAKLKVYNRKGSIYIEAAIFLPLVIIMVLNLSYLIKVIYFQEEIFYTLINEGRRLSLEAHLYEVNSNNKLVTTIIEKGPQNRIIFANRMTSKLKLDEQNNINSFSINEFKSMYRENQIEDLFRIELSFELENKLNKIFFEDFISNQVLVIRAWTGKSNIGNPYPFKDMQKKILSNIVYVYPRSGEKYHLLNCSYIQSYPTETVLTSQIRTKYDRCKICNPTNKIDGELVYIFRYGKDYHLGSCQLVNKYIISIDKTQAENEGYLKCNKCNGGD